MGTPIGRHIRAPRSTVPRTVLCRSLFRSFGGEPRAGRVEVGHAPNGRTLAQRSEFGLGTAQASVTSSPTLTDSLGLRRLARSRCHRSPSTASDSDSCPISGDRQAVQVATACRRLELAHSQSIGQSSHRPSTSSPRQGDQTQPDDLQEGRGLWHSVPRAVCTAPCHQASCNPRRPGARQCTAASAAHASRPGSTDARWRSTCRRGHGTAARSASTGSQRRWSAACRATPAGAARTRKVGQGYLGWRSSFRRGAPSSGPLQAYAAWSEKHATKLAPSPPVMSWPKRSRRHAHAFPDRSRPMAHTPLA
jgi:hypothetical protein